MTWQHKKFRAEPFRTHFDCLVENRKVDRRLGCHMNHVISHLFLFNSTPSILDAQTPVELTFRIWEMCQVVSASQRLALFSCMPLSNRSSLQASVVPLPRGSVALRSDLLVTLDCLDIGVSLVCLQGHAEQRPPTRNKPRDVSLRWSQRNALTRSHWLFLTQHLSALPYLPEFAAFLLSTVVAATLSPL